jgi:hypothetical protein
MGWRVWRNVGWWDKSSGLASVTSRFHSRPHHSAITRATLWCSYQGGLSPTKTGKLAGLLYGATASHSFHDVSLEKRKLP